MVSGGRFRGGTFQRRSRPQRTDRTPPRENSTINDVLNDYKRDENLQDQTGAILEGLQQDSVVPYWLEPVGDSGFYVPPNEDVEPWDCDRWPDSPFCGGTGFDPLDLLTFSPYSITPTFAVNRDLSEICVTIQTNFFAIALPPSTFCYRAPWARPLPPRPEAPPAGSYPTNQPDPPPEWFPFDFEYEGGACVYIVKITSDRLAWEFAGTTNDTVDVTMGRPTGGYWVGTINSGRRYRIIVPGISATGGNFRGGTDFFTVESPDAERSNRPYVVDIVPHPNLAGSCPALPQYPTITTPPYQPGDPPDMCNCQEMEEMLRLLMLRVGTTSYPVTVPQSLVDTKADTEQQQSLTDLLFWTIKQMDGLAGQFPIEIEIKDADPSQSGDQARKVSIPNIAEGIAEMMGLNIKSSVNSDIHTSFLMRLAAEVIATKNAALVTQDYAKANASYLGYKGNTVKRTVDYAFNVTQLDNLEKILSETKKTIIGWQDEDKNTAQAYFERLMFAAGIIKEAFFRNNDDKDSLLSQIASVLGNNDQTSEQENESWREFLRAINNAESGFNRNSPITPKVIDPSINLDEL